MNMGKPNEKPMVVLPKTVFVLAGSVLVRSVFLIKNSVLTTLLSFLLVKLNMNPALAVKTVLPLSLN